MKRKTRTASGPGNSLPIVYLVEGLERFGAEFKFTPAGSLIVRGLGKAPAELREIFFNCDAAQLVALLRGRSVQATSPGQAEAALNVSTVGQG